MDASTLKAGRLSIQEKNTFWSRLSEFSVLGWHNDRRCIICTDFVGLCFYIQDVDFKEPSYFCQSELNMASSMIDDGFGLSQIMSLTSSIVSNLKTFCRTNKEHRQMTSE